MKYITFEVKNINFSKIFDSYEGKVIGFFQNFNIVIYFNIISDKFELIKDTIYYFTDYDMKEGIEFSENMIHPQIIDHFMILDFINDRHILDILKEHMPYFYNEFIKNKYDIKGFYKFNPDEYSLKRVYK